MRMAPLLFTISLFGLLANGVHAETFSSTNQRVNLIELYTSEGCSSCPPADKWLNALQQRQDLWTSFIPLAFHVDYWDYIGWTDRFADNRFNQRQYAYADAQHLSSVYTPAILLNGREWRKRPWNKFPDKDQSDAGILAIHLDEKQLDAQFRTNLAKNQSVILNIALLGFGFESIVKHGENHGKILQHEFVVLGYKTVAMQPTKDGFIAESINLPTTSHASDQLAITAWINTIQDLTPLQATGGWIN